MKKVLNAAFLLIQIFFIFNDKRAIFLILVIRSFLESVKKPKRLQSLFSSKIALKRKVKKRVLRYKSNKICRAAVVADFSEERMVSLPLRLRRNSLFFSKLHRKSAWAPEGIFSFGEKRYVISPLEWS